MKTRPFLLHALSPLHAGTGHAADVIDLPIARMKGYRRSVCARLLHQRCVTRPPQDQFRR